MQTVQTREYFIDLIDSLSPLLSIDKQGRVSFCNLSFRQEFPRLQDPIGKDFLDLFNLNQDDWQILHKSLLHARKRSILNKEFHHNNKTYGYSLKPSKNEILFLLRDITDNKKLEKKIKNLYNQLLNLQENERQKIGQDLHDSVGQTILAAKLHFQAGQMEDGLAIIDRASQELREVYTSLFSSHLKELGLIPAVRELLRTLFSDGKAHFINNITSDIPQEIALQIYRIIQESCSNIIKHSEATEVHIELITKDNSIVLSVQDNGVGFQTELVQIHSKGFGLENIRRRVENIDGSIQIHSHPGKGTEIFIQIPFHHSGKLNDE
jgi:two-component system, NarL family, sensor kinase